MKILNNDPLGVKSIDMVKLSDAKSWAIRMSEDGCAYKSIDNYKRSPKASFFMAIQDDCIRKNPFDFQLSDVLEDTTELKIALTLEQEMGLLSFMESDKTYCKYYDDVVIILETGLCISKLCGLTLELDMKNKAIMVDHQLLSDTKIGYYAHGSFSSARAEMERLSA